MAPLPLAKLAGLVVKAITKPLAKRFKSEAASNDSFRGMCRAVGRGVHAVTGNLNNFLAGRFVAARPIGDSAAVSLGAEVLGEGIVVAVAGAVVLIEFRRSSKAKKASELKAAIKKKQEARNLALRFEEYEMRLCQLEKLVGANQITLSNSSLFDIASSPRDVERSVVLAPTGPVHTGTPASSLNFDESFDETGEDMVVAEDEEVPLATRGGNREDAQPEPEPGQVPTARSKHTGDAVDTISVSSSCDSVSVSGDDAPSAPPGTAEESSERDSTATISSSRQEDLGWGAWLSSLVFGPLRVPPVQP